MRDIVLEEGLSPADLEAASLGRARLALGPEAKARIAAAHARMLAAIAERRLIYGVTTGFGPLADRLQPPERAAALQRNLVYHLATGVGRPLPFDQARACVAARLCALAQGWSGASPALIEALLAVLDADLAPRIPEKGTVGASGDLTPLAHLALAVMGEGGFIDCEGRDVPTAKAFARLGIAPLALTDRDGLALVNGTSAMTGIAAIAVVRARRLLEWSLALQALHAEVFEGRAEAWSPQVAQARPHPGQAAAAATLRARIAGAPRIDAAFAAQRGASPEPQRDPRPLQDPYSTRCAPQILGACLDVLDFAEAVIARELNAATDNPLFPTSGPAAIHAGNFMGCHVALAADALRNAVVLAAAHAERRLARLADERRNGGLQAFLTGGEPGLDSGFMGAQVTATALVAELRSQGPASVQTLPTNGDNQDVVSLGTIAARSLAAAVEDSFRIVAIEALALVQAADLLQAPLSESGESLRAFVRGFSPSLKSDRPLAAEIENLALSMARSEP